MTTAQAAKGGLGALIKRGWNEIPDIVAGTGVALVGVVLGVVGTIGYYQRDGDNRRYKEDIVFFGRSSSKKEFSFIINKTPPKSEFLRKQGLF
uniref:Uncharacterized protein n=1 Tax=Megaselia scalaris TaxID=36166 RepID=T1GX67_MEGSC